MGKFRLNGTQIAMLGKRDDMYSWEDDGESAIANTNAAMARNGFSPLAMRGNYFVGSTDDNDNQIPHIG